MASPTKEIQKAAHSIAGSGKNNTGTNRSKTSGPVRALARAVETVRYKGICNTFVQLFRFRVLMSWPSQIELHRMRTNEF